MPLPAATSPSLTRGHEARERARAASEARRAGLRAAAARPDQASAAINRAIADLGRSARIHVVQIVKERARVFLAHPLHLDIVHPGLSKMDPADGLRICAALVARERGYAANGIARIGRFTIPANIRGAMIALRLRRWQTGVAVVQVGRAA